MQKFRVLVQAAITALLLFAMFGQASQAAMVGTQDLLMEQPSAVLDVQRQSIEKQLVELGVDAPNARQRVARMSDSQIAEISSRIAELPAGADAGGILLTIFIVFVITDVIGATDIFPFIKPVK